MPFRLESMFMIHPRLKKRLKITLGILLFLVLVAPAILPPPPEDFERGSRRRQNRQQTTTVSSFFARLIRTLPKSLQFGLAPISPGAFESPRRSEDEYGAAVPDQEIELLKTTLKTPGTFADLRTKADLIDRIAQQPPARITNEIFEMISADLFTSTLTGIEVTTEEDRLQLFGIHGNMIISLHEIAMKSARNAEEAHQITTRAMEVHTNEILREDILAQQKHYFPTN